jgi:hypothetical protein
MSFLPSGFPPARRSLSPQEGMFLTRLLPRDSDAHPRSARLLSQQPRAVAASADSANGARGIWSTANPANRARGIWPTANPANGSRGIRSSTWHETTSSQKVTIDRAILRPVPA